MTDPASICTILPWDSHFFGFTIARAGVEGLTPDTVAEILQWCHTQGVACLYFLAQASDPVTIGLAEEHGFRLVDIRLTLDRSLDDLRFEPPETPTMLVRPALPEDTPALEQIAISSFTQTRFFADPGFTRESSAALYRAWVRNSLAGMADWVLVVEDAGNVQGFITGTLDSAGYDNPTERSARIGLFGIAPEGRGHGFGHALLQRALEKFARSGARHVTVVTQGSNIPAQHVYQSHGFRTSAVQLWYHRWFTS